MFFLTPPGWLGEHPILFEELQNLFVRPIISFDHTNTPQQFDIHSANPTKQEELVLARI